MMSYLFFLGNPIHDLFMHILLISLDTAKQGVLSEDFEFSHCLLAVREKYFFRDYLLGALTSSHQKLLFLPKSRPSDNTFLYYRDFLISFFFILKSNSFAILSF